jgi:hypothetical protein
VTSPSIIPSKGSISLGHVEGAIVDDEVVGTIVGAMLGEAVVGVKVSAIEGETESGVETVVGITVGCELGSTVGLLVGMIEHSCWVDWVSQKVVKTLIWQSPAGKDADRLFKSKDRVLSKLRDRKEEGIEPVR